MNLQVILKHFLKYCWWKKSCTSWGWQFIPLYIYSLFFTFQGGCFGFLNHQLYDASYSATCLVSETFCSIYVPFSLICLRISSGVGLHIANPTSPTSHLKVKIHRRQFEKRRTWHVLNRHWLVKMMMKMTFLKYMSINVLELKSICLNPSHLNLAARRLAYDNGLLFRGISTNIFVVPFH